MTEERALARYVRELRIDQIPEDAVDVVKQVLLAVAGTVIAGAAEDGCDSLRRMLIDQGGKPEATMLIFGDKLPAHRAALINGTMARALDYCDAMAPGLHIGSSLVPASLAAVELRGSCSGAEFLAALTAGAEVASRLNLTEDEYNGFDPTGVAGVFGATAAAARILELDEEQVMNALALAFNRCGGSFQSNVDGCLAVRLIQGWVAESAVTCAQLAKAGLTGPSHFLGGIYGYLNLFAKTKRTPSSITNGLGDIYFLKQMVFKKYPSCGLTQGVTELALQMAKTIVIDVDKITSIEIRMPPYAYRLVGHDFHIGTNPRVDAQFSAKYCVANALIRGGSELSHFCEIAIRNPSVLTLIKRITVISDEKLDRRGHTAVDLQIITVNGDVHIRQLDIAPGFPGNSLTAEQHHSRFEHCLKYANMPLPSKHSKELIDLIQCLEGEKDVSALVRLLVLPPGDKA